MTLADCSARYLATQEMLDRLRHDLQSIGRSSVTPQLALGLYQLSLADVPVQVSHWAAAWGGGNQSYNVARAQELGLIECHRSPTDRRLNLLSLTEAGRELVNKLEAKMSKVERQPLRMAVSW